MMAGAPNPRFHRTVGFAARAVKRKTVGRHETSIHPVTSQGASR